MKLNMEMNKNFLALLVSSDDQNSEAQIKTIYYLIENYCKIFMLVIETLLDEIRTNVIQKCEIVYLHKSMKNFSIFGIGEILMQKAS